MDETDQLMLKLENILKNELEILKKGLEEIKNDLDELLALFDE